MGRQCFGRAPRWHSHPYHELAIVFSGECDWRIGTKGRRKRETVVAGEALLLSPETLHAEEIIRPREASIGWIALDHTAPAPPWCGRRIALGHDFEEIVRLFNAIDREQNQPGNELRLQLALQMILVLIARQAEHRHDQRPASASPGGLNLEQIRRIEAAAFTMRNNLTAPLSIAQVAAFHSFSPAHFSTLFRRHFLTTPRAFFREARVEKAAELLAGSSLTIKEIALETGFADSAHFCKAFRAHRGVAPGTYRLSEAHSSAAAISPLR